MGLPELKSSAGRAAFPGRSMSKTVSSLFFQLPEAPGILGLWLLHCQSSNASRAFLTSSHLELTLLPLSFTVRILGITLAPPGHPANSASAPPHHIAGSLCPVAHTQVLGVGRGILESQHCSACHIPRCSVSRSDGAVESSFLFSPFGFVPCVLLSSKGTETQEQPELNQSLFSVSERF